jgi:hypothetical protein
MRLRLLQAKQYILGNGIKAKKNIGDSAPSRPNNWLAQPAIGITASHLANHSAQKHISRLRRMENAGFILSLYTFY